MGIAIFVNNVIYVKSFYYQVNIIKFMDASFPVRGDEVFHSPVIIFRNIIVKTQNANWIKLLLFWGEGLT